MELYDGAWCRLRNGKVAGPAVAVTSFSGHQFLVGGLYYSVAGECQSGSEFDVVFSGKSQEEALNFNHIGADVISIASIAKDGGRIAAATTDVSSASSIGGAEGSREIDIAVATSFGLIAASVSFAASGAVSVSAQCLQIANGEMMPISDRALDRCGILQGDKWWTFREILVDRAAREVAA